MALNTSIPTLGPCRFPSPLRFAPLRIDSVSTPQGQPGAEEELGTCFVADRIRVRERIDVDPERPAQDEVLFEKAGPRAQIFFDPGRTTAAIVTCGGLSPGLNNVIRSAYFQLSANYGVPKVLGIRNGYQGLNPATGPEPLLLTSDRVGDIDKLGGTILGSSRGPQDPAVMVDYLDKLGVNVLFTVGGDGTLRGTQVLYEEIQRRGLPIATIGIPKTIDNDIPYVDTSFGYATALEKAAEVIEAAHVEARGASQGVGLVKLMGRHAGFIAAGATVVNQQVNFCLVPEIPFPLHGEDGLLAALERRLAARDHAVVVVAEGAGQHLFPEASQRRDASGNLLSQDIGLFLRDEIRSHFARRNLPLTLKYLDPSYFIRSVPASAYDRYVAEQLTRRAVHAGMAGKTGMYVGIKNGHFVHVPVPLLNSRDKRLSAADDLWLAVLQVTGQPRW